MSVIVRAGSAVKLPIAYIDVRFSAHATEDPEKVKTAALNLFPEEQRDEITFKSRKLKGHYGNPIILFETRIKNKDKTKTFTDHLIQQLLKTDKEQMLQKSRIQDQTNSIYIRLDKQAAFRNQVSLREDDPIRIHIRLRTKRSLAEIHQEVGLRE